MYISVLNRFMYEKDIAYIVTKVQCYCPSIFLLKKKVAKRYNIILDFMENLCLVSTTNEQKREPSLSLLVGIGFRSAHAIWGSIRGRVGFTLELFDINK